MPNEKKKSENFQLLGGINSKFSPVELSPLEFTDLTNFDFQQPNSLTHRWGSTQYIGQTYPGPINSLFEFTKLDGSSYVVQSYSGGIFYGATTGNCQGMSFSTQSASLQLFGEVGLAIRQNFSGQNYWKLDNGINVLTGVNYFGVTGNPIYGANGGLDGTTFYIDPQVQSDNILSQTTFQNFLFMADGNKFVKFNGTTTFNVGLPPPLFATSLVGGISVVASDGSSAIGFQFGPSFGTYHIFASYVNNRGFEGPPWPLFAFVSDSQFNSTTVISFAGVVSATGMAGFTLQMATPLQYGISSIKIYSYYDAYNVNIGQTYVGFNGGGQFYSSLRQRFWSLETPVELSNQPASGSTITTLTIGSTMGGQTLVQQNLIGPLQSTIAKSYLPLGFTLGASLPGGQYALFAAMTNYYPRFLETYQNRLMLAGFSATPSTVWFSDIGEPEGYTPDANFEVRTNDGDVITGIKSYSTKFYIFKNNSFHVLTGDSPNNFFVQQVSDQYGCLNNRCAVTFDDVIVFLDTKGVVLFNGGTLDIISKKIQPIIDTINYSAAVNTACMVHDKLRSQVLVAVPINGSTTNNVTLVYDYLVGAWTKYDGFSPSAFATIRGRNNTKNAFYGDNSGRVNWFGSSFLADNGAGFTTYLKTRFLHDMGDTTQKMFRRLYLNADATGTTLVFQTNFFQDYGSSVVLGTTMVLGGFQNRIDFGISAKSLAFEISNLQAAVPLRIHGFTIESRFLRGT